MRIISQNSCFDIPYDLYMVGMIKVDNLVEVYARDGHGVEFILGDYKTTARAKAEVAQARAAYGRGQKVYQMKEDDE